MGKEEMAKEGKRRKQKKCSTDTNRLGVRRRSSEYILSELDFYFHRNMKVLLLYAD